MKVPRDEPSEEIFLNLTAFIDMMLVLVIFFLATSRFHEEERDEAIRLAKSRASTTLPIATPSDLLVINIDKDGRRIVDGKPRSLEELEEIARARRAQKENAEVVVRGDVRGYFGPVADTLEMCVRLGFKTPNITYEKGDGK